MSKIALSGNASGTGTFSIVAPNSNTDRTLTLPDEAGTVLTSGGAIDVNASAPADSLAIDASGNVGIGTTSPSSVLHLSTSNDPKITLTDTGFGASADITGSNGNLRLNSQTATLFDMADSEVMRIDTSGNLLVGATSDSGTNYHLLSSDGFVRHVRDDLVMIIDRRSSDGALIAFRQNGTTEGSVSVSGTTVSYNGGHLARWSRLADDSKDTSIVKGTVMTNLDEMVEWSHETTYWTEDDELPVDEDGNAKVAVGDVKKEAYTEENEQLNKMAVSSVEGDPNVAGVFVNWDDDDEFNDMNIAMTGDMVIRIAEGVTVERGDLLMSAGDGTAKPQGDDIVRSKTIAKVTSTHVSHTYDDGSYLVPCVLMAC